MGTGRCSICHWSHCRALSSPAWNGGSRGPAAADRCSVKGAGGQGRPCLGPQLRAPTLCPGHRQQQVCFGSISNSHRLRASHELVNKETRNMAAVHSETNRKLQTPWTREGVTIQLRGSYVRHVFKVTHATYSDTHFTRNRWTKCNFQDEVKCNRGEVGDSQGAVGAGLHGECRAAGRGSGPQPHTRVALVKME